MKIGKEMIWFLREKVYFPYPCTLSICHLFSCPQGNADFDFYFFLRLQFSWIYFFHVAAEE